MGISVRVPDGLKKLGENYKKQVPARIRALAEETIREIVERTQGGKDYQGSAFVDYTDKYKAWKSGFTTQGSRRNKVRESLRADAAGSFHTVKIKRAVAPRFGAGGSVNLTYSGAMLRSIKAKIARIAKGFLVTLYVGAGNVDKARGAMFGYGPKKSHKREFFLLNEKQIEKFRTLIRELITNG